MKFENEAGSISAKDRPGFERMLFRISRGNALVKFASLRRLSTDENPELDDRVGYIVFFRGDELHRKIRLVCNAYRAKKYDLTFLHSNIELKKATATKKKEVSLEEGVIEGGYYSILIVSCSCGVVHNTALIFFYRIL